MASLVVEPNNPVVPFAGQLPAVFDTSLLDSLSSSSATVASATGGTQEQRWVLRQLGAYEPEYIRMMGCSASLVTFNVACKKPPHDLSFVLGSSGLSPRDRGAPDLVVVGLQEVDMSASAMIREETEAAIPWLAAIAAFLEVAGDNPAYRIVVKRQLVGLMLIVCVKVTSLPFVRDVRYATIATGALGTVGNKGAVGCRLTYRLSTLCFLVCHLAAHQKAIGRRNQDIAQILSALNLAEPDPTGTATAVALPTSHDICFVLGDLNYRIDTTYEAACELAARRDIKGLLRDDQFVKELQQLHTPWKGFTEFTPNFLPTYRFDIGTDRYDTSEKRRIPSYTDRIAYCPGDELHSKVELVLFESCMDVKSSDHKPVVARVNIPVKEEDPAKKETVLKRLRDAVQSLGISRVSSASIRPSVVDLSLGVVSYASRAKATVELLNTGNCVAEVHILRRCNDDVCDGSWLRVSPGTTVSVLPGRTALIDVYAIVDWLSLRWAVTQMPYQGRQSRPTETFLMLCVIDGPTIPIHVSCEIVLGCMGTTLDALVGAGLLPCSEAFGCPPSAAPPPATVPIVAKEIWHLVDALSRGAVPRTQELFEGATSDATEIQRVLDWINTVNSPIDFSAVAASAEAVAGALILLLRDLQLSVIPPTHHAAAISAGRAGNASAVMAVVRSLPVNHHNTLLYLISFGRFLLRPEHTEASGLTAENLAAAWAPVLFALSPASRPVIARPFGTASPSAGGASMSTPQQASPNPSPLSNSAATATAAVPAGKAALTLRQEFEAEMESAVKFIYMLLATRPELSA